MELEKQRVFIPNVFQKEALEKINKVKQKKGVVVMPTGTGKTFFASLWFKQKIEQDPNSKLLFICHNKDILSQANEKEFQNCLLNFGLEYGYYNSKEKDIKQCTFATTQTLARNLDKFNKDDFDYIIVDECHHYQAKSFRSVLQYFKPKFMLGLTATPNRMDGLNIFDILGKKVYEAKISDAIKRDLLTKINYWCVDNDIDYSEVKWNGSNYDEKDLNRKICIKEYDDAILKEYNKTLREKFGKKKTICFCATVEHTHRMAKLFKENGIKSVGLTGRHRLEEDKMPRGKREEVIKGFKDGEYDIIFVRDLFNEGVDIPDCDSVMMLRPTQSHTIFTQQIGRGLRKAEGKDNLLILDFTGNCRKCVINFEVLGEMIEKDIIHKIKSENKEREKNEIIILNNGCEVRLTKSKYNLIHNQGRGYSRQELIRQYNECKKKLERPPIAFDMHKNGYAGYDTYKTVFGLKWNDFRKLMGDNVIVMNKTEDEEMREEKKKIIREEYLIFYRKKGFYPSVRDVRKNNREGKKHLITDNTIRRLWGSYAKFIKEIGGTPRKNTILDLSKEKIIKDYNKIKKELKRIPFSEEINNKLDYSWSSFVRQYFFNNEPGEYGRFLKEIIKGKDYDLWRNQISKVPRPNGNSYSKYSKDEIKKDYIKIYKKLGRHLTSSEVYYRKFKGLPTGWGFKKHLKLKDYSIKEIHNYFDKVLDKKDNIKITSTYKPITIIPHKKLKRKQGEGKEYKGMKPTEYSSKEDKIDIRKKIISKIQDNDLVLLLESPELSAIKEIEKQKIKPRKIIIPNNKEFKKLAEALKNYKTDLNIELINTSALQYLVDSKEKFDFVWLDYCGAFTYYIKDLDVLFAKHLDKMKLILTYNLFDPAKDDDSYYFTRVIDYVLGKTENKRIRLINDITYRYKKQMYNVGFEINNMEVKND